jgi:brefeldin A-resistance guanine nucleotide exchange factor 1
LVDVESPHAIEAASTIVYATTHCKFEATDAVSDECVLMRILSLLHLMLSSPMAMYLTDEAVCEMVETCFSMCFQMRLTGTAFLYKLHYYLATITM